jgi:DNA polymerase-2
VSNAFPCAARTGGCSPEPAKKGILYGMALRGFIVHAWPDMRRDRIYCVGRLDDGRSFAAVEERWRPAIHVFAGSRKRALSLLGQLRFTEEPAALAPFSGTEGLCCLRFSRYGERAAAAAILKKAAIPSPDAGIKPVDLFLIERLIRGPLELDGRVMPGRLLDVVIRQPELYPSRNNAVVPLRTAAVDIETDTVSGCIRAVSIVWTGGLANGIVTNDEGGINGIVRVVSAAGQAAHPVHFCADERSLLAAFIDDIRRIDPDVITGWNFLDFDFPRLAERCKRLRVPFTLGRSAEEAVFLPGDPPGSGMERLWRRRAAAAIVPGRQALDALRIVRAGTWGSIGELRGFWGDDPSAGFGLERVSQTVLGEGKIVHASGDEKIAALDRLYAEDPFRFGEYCLRDSELALRILAKTGLFRLTLERASLTGVSLDKAWTSVVSFERVYGTELRRRGIAPPAPDSGADVSGAAGGTVLEPLPGLFTNVAVFDFRSLYPTIMRTFNIDPYSHAHSADAPPAGAAISAPVVAPNGAAFSRVPGPLPQLIAEYFAARTSALEAGDSIAAQVYKILMNSFYGVLGTGACRYGRSALAGAITSFARKWLLVSRDWFNAQGFRVLYGDTDSLFVETGFGDGTAYGDFAERCGGLAQAINGLIAASIRTEYNLESFIELRFEKAYRRFLIPPLRSIHPEGAGRGRAKGYSGYLILPPDGAQGETGSGGGTKNRRVEVKGMEAVRSDSTPLTRRLQLELLELIFSDCDEAAFREKVRNTLEDLRAGKLDSELMYRKRLVRYPETYTASTPPQVKAARALGWTKRRGTVEYLWTLNGPEPLSRVTAPIDYDHYADSQVFPVAHSIAEAAHWNTGYYAKTRPGDAAEGQIDLPFRACSKS